VVALRSYTDNDRSSARISIWAQEWSWLQEQARQLLGL
jgi:hypothetical protein